MVKLNGYKDGSELQFINFDDADWIKLFVLVEFQVLVADWIKLFVLVEFQVLVAILSF